MKDYSWIKPGVKAVIIKTRHFPESLGKTVTIKSDVDMTVGYTDKVIGASVDIEEEFYAYHPDGQKLILKPSVEILEPLSDFPNWNAISEGKVANLPSFTPQKEEA